MIEHFTILDSTESCKGDQLAPHGIKIENFKPSNSTAVVTAMRVQNNQDLPWEELTSKYLLEMQA